VPQAARMLAEEAGTVPVALPTRPATPTVTRKIKAVSPLGFVLHGIDSAHPYLAARGIEIGTAQQFGIGFYGGPGFLNGRLVIPIHNAAGELVAYCGRSLDASEPRYRFPSGFAKSEVLFNLHRAAAVGQDRVVVVEGFFDCLRLHQAGVAAVALMGTSLSDTQRQLLEFFRHLILMLDGDEAGHRATVTLAARLRPYASISVIPVPDAVQPDQLSAAEIRQILQPYNGRAAGQLC
jgi:DNA primase